MTVAVELTIDGHFVVDVRAFTLNVALERDGIGAGRVDKSFQPKLVNLQWTWESPEVNIRLEQASRALAERLQRTLKILKILT